MFGLVAAVLVACEAERPPSAARDPDRDAPNQPVSRTLASDETAVLTYAGDRGTFADTQDPASVPDAAKGLVRVTPLTGDPPPPGRVYVANLRTPEPDGSLVLSTIPREQFEELALGQGRSSAVKLPEGLEPPPLSATAAGEVIVYKTAWCGVCKTLEAYLKRKGVDYVAKDIEADRSAAAELQAKAREKGMATGSVPVIDVGGELLVGFDRARLEKLLAR